MSVFWIFILLNVVCVIYGIKYFQKYEGYISTYTVFSLTGLFYYLAIPIECALTGHDEIALGEIRDLPLLDSTKTIIAIFSLLAFLGFGIGLKNARFGLNNERESNKNETPLPISVLTFIIVAVFCLLIFYRDEVLASETYEGNVSIVYSNPLYTLLVDWIVIYCATLAGANIIKFERITLRAIFFMLPGLFWGLYASTKDQLLIVLLAGLSYFTVVRQPRNMGTVLIGLSCCIFLAPIGMLWFSLYRAGVEINFDEMESILSLGLIRNTDPAGPIAVFNDIYNSTVEFRYGQTYLETFYLWIPKFIWSNRPPDLAEMYAQQTIGDWTPGKGLGYSLLIEGYINFSCVGVFIQYFVFGFIWGKGWNRFLKYISKTSIVISKSFYVIYGYFLLIIMHRSPFSGTPKQLFLTALPFLVFSSVFRKSFWGRKPL